MKKFSYKPLFIFTGAIFLCGLLFALAGTVTGGNYYRASANINRLLGNDTIVRFEYSVETPEDVPTPDDEQNYRYYYDYGIPDDGYYYSQDPDIYEFFREFGLDDDFGSFFMPPGTDGTIPEAPEIHYY